MRYELKCDACGHDASEHDCGFGGEALGCEASDSTGNTCICTVCSASLYAAECERLARQSELDATDAMSTRLNLAQTVAERDAARAECERIKRKVNAALDKLGATHPAIAQAICIARTALDGQEKDNG